MRGPGALSFRATGTRARPPHPRPFSQREKGLNSIRRLDSRKFPGALEKHMGLDVDDLEFRGLCAGGRRQQPRDDRGARPARLPLRAGPLT